MEVIDMVDGIWEDFISLNSRASLASAVLPPASHFVALDDGQVGWDRGRIPLQQALMRDTYPLPTEADREGYYGANHFNYWASGLRDYCQLREWMQANKVVPGGLLDMGCASGRLIRHAGLAGEFDTVAGCDINALHVEWVARHLPQAITAFQNTSLPTLPLPDASVSVVTAFSVFTHIESFVSTWLMELRRILRPGGIAWLTVHADRTWRDVEPSWPLHPALQAHPDYAQYRDSTELPSDRLVFRWRGDGSYSSNVFYSYEYIRRAWGRIMPVIDIFSALPLYQDIVVLRRE